MAIEGTNELRDRLRQLKQLRWRAAHAADGSDGDAATDRLIRLHNAVLAVEAALAEGEPEATAPMDLAGYELPEVKRPVARVEPEVAARRQARPGGMVRASGFMKRGASVRYPHAHPWFAAWRRAVEQGGYRTRLSPASPNAIRVNRR